MQEWQRNIFDKEYGKGNWTLKSEKPNDDNGGLHIVIDVVMPNGPKLSHACCDSRQPKTRSDKSKAQKALAPARC